jgi:arylsulfatase A-like enzyme
VLVVVDTLRADHLGLYGAARDRTPELDRWGARGAVFERAFAPSSWTLPSVASLLTGLYPQAHGAGRYAVPARPGRAARRANTGLGAGVPTLAELLAQRGYRTGGFVTNTFLRDAFGFARGFAHFDAASHRGAAARPAAAMVDAGLAWLDAQGEAPFLLFLHLMDPHLPYAPAPPARGRFAADDAAGRLRVPIPHRWAVRDARPPLDAAERAFVAALYAEEVAYVDLQVGRLLDALAARGLFERALVVFAADHGEELWDHGDFEHGHSLYGELLRVPLVFWAPGLAPRRHAAPVSLVDVLPTLLDALSLPVPEGLDGVSLWPTLARGADPPAREIVAHNTLRGHDRQALLAWPWKLVVDAEGGASELYDLAADPGETRDLRAAEPERAAQLLARLRERLPAGAPARAREVELDPELRRELRALGYAE